MKIKIEQGQVIIELNELEFIAFEKMFANLNDDNHTVILRGEEWPDDQHLNGNTRRKILPFHLCRTIGEGRHAPTGDCCRKPGKAVFGIL